MSSTEISSQMSFDSLASEKQPKLVEKKPVARQLAPMLRQYQDYKEKYPEHVILCQVGDFYEIFFEDAKTVAAALNIRLTTRDKNKENATPMCGIPIHALDNYLPKLITQGFSCVIVSQLEDDKAAQTKGPVRRDITRIVTPGVRYEGDGIDEKRFNFLCAAFIGISGQGAVACADVSTGLLKIQEVETRDELREALERVSPAELILPSSVNGREVSRLGSWLRHIKSFTRETQIHTVTRPFDDVSKSSVSARLEKVLRNGVYDARSLDKLSPEAITALKVLFDYLEEIAYGRPLELSQCVVDEPGRVALIDSATRRNLELFETRLSGERTNSLFSHIDRTKTAMGARVLSDWLISPLSDKESLAERHDAVEEFVGNQQALSALREALTGIRDIERVVLSRITARRATPYELRVLADSITSLPSIKAVIGSFRSALFLNLVGRFDALEDLCQRLSCALVDEPPTKANEGGIFRPGFHQQLDEFRSKATEGRRFMAELEAREREATKITSLKLKYNNVFGYFIEVTKTHASKVPARYERKQTLVNAERYVTPELKELEQSILSSKSRQTELEKSLFIELRDHIASHAACVHQTSKVLSELDVLGSLAAVAIEREYLRPTMYDDTRLEIISGRHPVIETLIGAHNFVPNNTSMDGKARRFAVLTGPNMGGKSTYLRQIGIIQLLAQIGSFVPAKRAELGIVDRIFTRIGAADDITRGDSTFMVEMREASSIMRKATSRSLVLIDEIGRGTATTDGLAIAQAIAEWLHDHIGCRTVFATHFHELTLLSEHKQGAYSISVGVNEKDNEIEFTHRIEEKAADKSYGIEVARLAGLPEALLKRAEAVLLEVDKGEQQHQTKLNLSSGAVEAGDEPFVELLRQMAERIRGYAPNTMTPIEALHEITKLVEMLGAEIEIE